MANRFTKKAENALKQALEYSGDLGHTYIGSEHLLMGLDSDGDSVSAKMLASHGVSFENIKSAVLEVSGRGIPGKVSSSDMTPGAKKIIEQSALEAQKYSQKFIGTEHLLLALVNVSDCVGARILERLKVYLHELKNELVAFAESTDISKHSPESNKKERSTALSGCPTISEYGRDLTAAAKNGRLDPIIGREKETERVIQILSRRTKNNPCLIGEPGVGKTAVVEGLAQKICAGEVPQMLRGKIVITLDIPAMIAGAKYRGEFEERMKNVMRESAQNPDVILFIDEIHTIIGAGAAEGAVDAANIIKPALARGEMQIIGATTIGEYRKHVEKDAALERRFQSVTVEEPSVEDAERILKGLREKYEEHHKLKISDDALHAAVVLSSRYITDRFLPDKAIDLVDEAASRLKIGAYTAPPKLKELENKLAHISAEKEKAVISQSFERAAKLRDDERKVSKKYESAKAEWEKRAVGSRLCVCEDDIAEVVTQWTGIPVNKLMESESERLLGLSERLKSAVIGQDRAADAVANAIRRGRTGISDPNRPIGSFIFLGPTGVGKTELTKALAQALFGSRESVLRFDMSEYMEKHSVSKLIGSPPGYVGYDEGGVLTEKIRRKPYSVVLFDEIEKADPDVFNLLLQVLDEGVLTDSQGREADFRNSVMIMTSNAGASYGDGLNHIGFSRSSSDDGEGYKRAENDRMMKALKETFRPEFLNRVDDIVIFERLKRPEIEKIAYIMLSEFAGRVAEKGIELKIDNDAISFIAERGYDEIYGARPLRRAIITLAEDKFAEELLKGNIVSGDSVIMKCKANDKGEKYIAFERREADC